jgi:hypothetical protein
LVIPGFNEPEVAAQAAMSPADAAMAYRQWITPYAGSASLGSPAVSNDGYDWIQEFLGLCQDCAINFVATHWYGDWSNIADFKNWVTAICTLGNRPVWITEVGEHCLSLICRPWLTDDGVFAVQFEGYGSPEQQSVFMAQALPWLDTNDCVARYSYFGSADPDKILLMDGGPALSPLGNQYVYETG